MKDHELYSWVLRGTQRTAVIRVMDRPKIPKNIRKEALEFNNKLSRANTSRVLRAFVKKGIGICLNEEKRTGRLYKLTKIGNDIREDVLKISKEPSLPEEILLQNILEVS